MITSEAGRKRIQIEEGFRHYSYMDDAGVWTIGYGHTKGVKQGLTCTKEEADQWLEEDLGTAESAINNLVKVPLSQDQFDALVSWEFNTGGIRNSTLLKVLNTGNYAEAANQMRRWKYVTDPHTKKKIVNQGLESRREREASLFFNPIGTIANAGSATPTPPPEVVTQTTTGKLQIGALLTGIGAAITQGMQMAEPVIVGTKKALDSTAGFSGHWQTLIGVLVIFSIGFSLATLWHKRKTLMGG